MITRGNPFQETYMCLYVYIYVSISISILISISISISISIAISIYVCVYRYIYLWRFNGISMGIFYMIQDRHRLSITKWRFTAVEYSWGSSGL